MFFSIFDNRDGKTPNFDELKGMFIDGANIVKRHEQHLEVMSVDAFILPRKRLLTDGSLIEFYEWEIEHQTITSMGLATRISTYGKSGLLNGQPYTGQGEKHIQLILTSQGWKIASIIWQDYS
ncbi:hypothetical protein [Thalassotalea ganghwensis]